ncbi:MAG: hypothetical protein Unbinned6354contig1000_28 [Prokaryotic dsDNA virus sp.]|nr:hypothetical protein [Cytophagaceae bacterium]QDP54325.1 MAG: hypothetical protein Unbinned6354contig1000_28 [Prokaryotic dsDNA virus sp.]|tara:strand:+ start:2201 stop:2623 length:423 start_codon:yes stop_codon:yes gene_type:complete
MKNYKLSESSKKNLATCNLCIVDAVEYALQFVDIGVVCGHRPISVQMSLMEQGLTKTLDSKHCRLPSHAVDLMIYVAGFGYVTEKTDPEKYRQYYGRLAGILETYCHHHGLHFRWGGDWDKDDSFNDQSFDDLVHFEIYP